MLMQRECREKLINFEKIKEENINLKLELEHRLKTLKIENERLDKEIKEINKDSG